MTLRSAIYKRVFDVIFSSIGILFFCPIILVCWLLASIETKSNGFFLQKRIGQYGKVFKTIKVKTMHDSKAIRSSITVSNMSCITKTGLFFRKYKLDELPQLFNVFIGDMSFVGPRPDVPGYADKLKGEDRIILQMRPGITGPASIKYSNEELLLFSTSEPKKYNDEVIWPDKVRINKDYYKNWSMVKDIKYIFMTIGLSNEQL